MKKCLICGATSSGCITCPECGEASWDLKMLPKDPLPTVPKAADSTSPVSKDIGEEADISAPAKKKWGK